MTRAEAARHLADGQFGKGSMGPKIEAALRYLDGGGTRVVITSPDQLEDAVEGRAGTIIEGECAGDQVSRAAPPCGPDGPGYACPLPPMSREHDRDAL